MPSPPGLNQASTVLAADPLGTMTALEQLRTRSDAFLGRIEQRRVAFW